MEVALAGRARERGRIAVWLDSIPHGSSALTVTGQAGIGKTALWRETVALAQARGWQVLTALPAEGEAMLGYSAINDLLDPITARLVELPEPEREALEVALMRAEPRHQLSEQAVSAGTASLLRRVSRSGPLLVAVDDVQWLDRSSAEVLSHVLRHLPSAGVGVLTTARVEPHDAMPTGLDDAVSNQRINLTPLGPNELDRLLHDHLGRRFNRPTLARISEASRGNPLFALELARALIRTDREIKPGQPLPVPGSLRHLITERLSTSSAAARKLLLAVAAAPSPPIDVLEAVLGKGALAEAERSGLVELRAGRAVSAHPLVAEAAYELATTAERRAMHATLAAHARRVEDRARHLALAGQSSNREIAEALHQAAMQATARGAGDTALELARLAVEHSSADGDDRWSRLLLLGELSFRAGDTSDAIVALERVRGGSADRLTRARALQLLAHIAWETDSLERCADLATEALDMLRPGDPPEVSAALHTTMAGVLLIDLEQSATHAAAALDLLSSADDPDPGPLAAALVQAAAVDFMIGRGLDEQRYRQAMELEQRTITPRLAEGALACLAADRKYADHIDRARKDFLELLARAELDDESSIPYALGHLAQLELWAGEWSAAETYVERHIELAERLDQPSQRAQAEYTRALIAAYRGDCEAARRIAEEQLADPMLSEDPWTEAGANGLLGMACVSDGDPAGAARHLARWNELYVGMGVHEPGRRRSMADWIESLVAIGDLDRAHRELAGFERLSLRLDRPSGLGQVARAKAVICASEGELSRARESIAAGLAAYDRTTLPYDRARLRLVEGAICRRSRERPAARDALVDALATFERLGARTYASRARAELERLDPRVEGNELTPTEQRLAELVAGGRTVKTVAEMEFMSPRTVETHIAKVYRKLGVRSRAELGARLTRDR